MQGLVTDLPLPGGAADPESSRPREPGNPPSRFADARRALLAAGLLATLATALGSGCASSPPTPARLRVATYNIHHGEGVDGRWDLPRLAAVIERTGADLIALQEVDRGTTRSAGVDQAAELGRLTGLHAVFGAAMAYDGGEYGEAVLSRLPILSSTVHALPHAPDHEPRAALEVRVELPGGRRVRFVGTHLDHTQDPADRVAQMAALEAALAAEPDLPTVLAGDFNDEPFSRSLSALADRWMDALGPDRRATWPAQDPRKAIDHVFVTPGERWRKLGAWVVEETVASDHRPVVVDLELVPTTPTPGT